MEWSAPEPFRCPAESVKAQLIKSAAGGQADAQLRLGRLKLSSCKGMHDPVGGVQLLEQASAKGNSHAQLALADAYRTGQLGENDPAKALYWYSKAALLDNARARNSWAVALYLGSGGTARNPPAAARLFQITAQQDLREAQYNLGALYDLGVGVPQNLQHAREWYVRAAEQRYGPAEYRLGMLWELGLGGERNRQTAISWYTKAKEDGSAAAILRLGFDFSNDPEPSGYYFYIAGIALLNGNGVAKDESKGVSLLEKAAAMDYAPALFDVAWAYSNGRGVKKNEAKGIDYYERVIEARRHSPPDRNLITDRTLATAYNNVAWVMVTSTDAKVRNPQKALTYALQGVELTESRQPFALDTLAYAYFQAGQIDQAIETESKALAMQPQNKTYANTLAQFKEKQVATGR